MRIAIDLDGCLARYTGWKGISHIGEPLPGARDACWDLYSSGHQLFVYSCRTSQHCHEELSSPTTNPDGHSPAGLTRLAINAVRSWLAHNGFPPLTVYAGHGKPEADLYLDDRALTVAPQQNPAAWSTALAAITLMEEQARVQRRARRT